MSIFAALLIATAMLSSYGGNSVESDAKKMAEIQCKALKLGMKAASGDKDVLEESAKLQAETAALTKEMDEKYKSEDDKKKLAEAILKELGNCKD